VCFTLAWGVGSTLTVYIAAVVGIVIAIVATSCHHLTVEDRGDRLAIQFGPLPLPRTFVRSADIESAQVGRALLLDGWGVRYTVRGGWVWNLWGRVCVVIHYQNGGTLRIIAGAESWEQIAECARSKEPFFRRFLTLPGGPPSHDTFNRVLAQLDPDAFADRFGRWMAWACEATGLVHVAIDGNSARRSTTGTFTGCRHLVEAWAVENRLILGMRSVPEGGHEIITIPDLLAARNLSGALVTIDAAGCQKGTVGQIRQQGGDYLVCVKGNRAGLRDAVAGVFAGAADAAFATCEMSASVDDGHVRHEERYVSAIRDPDGLPAGWAGAGAVVMVGRERRVSGEGNTSATHSYLTPLAGRGGRGRRVHPQPLVYRERFALVLRPRVPRGRQPGTGGTRRGQPGYDPTGRPVAAQADRYERHDPDPAHESRLGRQLPAQSTRCSNDRLKCAHPASTPERPRPPTPGDHPHGRGNRIS
jgi:predicted transposase YbfD/YdcC